MKKTTLAKAPLGILLRLGDGRFCIVRDRGVIGFMDGSGDCMQPDPKPGADVHLHPLRYSAACWVVGQNDYPWMRTLLGKDPDWHKKGRYEKDARERNAANR